MGTKCKVSFPRAQQRIASSGIEPGTFNFSVTSSTLYQLSHRRSLFSCYQKISSISCSQFAKINLKQYNCIKIWFISWWITSGDTSFDLTQHGTYSPDSQTWRKNTETLYEFTENVKHVNKNVLLVQIEATLLTLMRMENRAAKWVKQQRGSWLHMQ